MIGHIRDGFESIPGKTAVIAGIKTGKQRRETADLTSESGFIIFAMPGQMKQLFEKLDQSVDFSGKRVLFLIQSGFFEAHQSRWVESYFIRLAERWGAGYSGTLILGGIEGIQLKPRMLKSRLFNNLKAVGRHIATAGILSPEFIKRINSRENLLPISRFIFEKSGKVGPADWYWTKLLKENGAFEKRFDRPY